VHPIQRPALSAKASRFAPRRENANDSTRARAREESLHVLSPRNAIVGAIIRTRIDKVWGFQQARDIMETGFLLDYFRTSPEQITVWRKSDRATRRKLFEPVKIRQELDKRDGDTEMKRAAEYSKLSELASHATYRGFTLTTRGSFAEFGPFVEAINLKAWLHEMVLRLGPSAVMYANQFPNADVNLIRAFQMFGTDLILGFKDHDG
jgi:hypothetical protein